MKVQVMPKLAAAIGLAIILSGCVLSVDSIVPESGATFDPRLLGRWEEFKGSDRAVVSSAAENEYTIAYRSGLTPGSIPQERGPGMALAWSATAWRSSPGTDPAKASIAFYWGTAADGGPGAMFPDRGTERLWFGNGVRVGDRLVLFLARTLAMGTGIGFENAG